MVTKKTNQHDLTSRMERLLAQSATQLQQTPAEELQQLISELKNHQLELEIQNTELQLTQADLIASRDRYADLYDSAPVGYLTILASGEIVAANLVAAKLLGAQREQLVGTKFNNYISAEYEHRLLRHCQTAFESGGRQALELRLKPDFKDRYLRLDSVPLLSGEHAVDTLRIALTDITRETIAAGEQAEVEGKLQVAERLKTLGTIAGGVAHDFNNLLCPIMTYAELAAFQTAEDSPVQSHLQSIMQAASQAAGLCREMLSYVGTEQLSLSPLNTYDLIHKVAQRLKPKLKNNVQLTLPTAQQGPVIEADPVQIERVLANLITNAIEAIGDQVGHVFVSLYTTALDRAQLRDMTICSQATPGEFVCIEIADEGCGMDAETQARIFDPFFTTKFSGSGLGMAAIVGVAHSHQAAISVDSKLHRGTRIRIYLPASQSAPAEALPDQATPLVQGTGTILVVDDDAAIRESTRSTLQLAGYNVLLATSGREAIELFKRQAESIDAVMLDYLMPDINGVETLKFLLEIKPKAIVLMRSAVAMLSAKLPELEGCGFAGYIQKPCTAHDLTRQLKHAIP